MEIAVLGLGRFGMQLARTLAQEGHSVLAVDRDERIVQGLANAVTKAATLDITDREALEQVGVGDAEVGVIATTDVEASVLAMLNLQSLGVGDDPCEGGESAACPDFAAVGGAAGGDSGGGRGASAFRI